MFLTLDTHLVKIMSIIWNVEILSWNCVLPLITYFTTIALTLYILSFTLSKQVIEMGTLFCVPIWEQRPILFSFSNVNTFSFCFFFRQCTRVLPVGSVQCHMSWEQCGGDDVSTVWAHVVRALSQEGLRLCGMWRRCPVVHRQQVFRSTWLYHTHSRPSTGSETTMSWRPEVIPGSQLHVCSR